MHQVPYIFSVPLIFDHPRSPIGGHSFLDPSGVLIRADKLLELPPKIASYRSINGLPAGNPEAEIEARYAVDSPWLISRVGTTRTIPEDPVARWLNRAWRTPIRDWAEAETVNARMATCETCEHYAPDHPFSKDASRRLLVMGAGKLREAGACKVHHWACGLAVLAQAPEVTTGVDGCWASPRSPL